MTRASALAPAPVIPACTDGIAPHHAVCAVPAEALHDPDLLTQVEAISAGRFRSRDPKARIDQRQVRLDFDWRRVLTTCPVPFRVIPASEDVQRAFSMCRVVSNLAPDGTFHEIARPGHVSMDRHRRDIVSATLREIPDGALRGG